MALTLAVIGFLVSLAVSMFTIYIATKLLGEREGLGTAFTAAIIGSAIYGIAFYFFGTGLLGSSIAGIAWLIALGTLYKVGWLKALFIALVIWAVTLLASVVLPTVGGQI